MNYDGYTAMKSYDDYAAEAAESQDLVPKRQADIYDIQNNRIKMETAARLRSALVIHFTEVFTITETSHDRGALLIEVVTAAHRLSKEVWIPKKLCSNLDLEAKTICVWDRFWNQKAKDELTHMGGLAYPAEYYKGEDS